MPQSTKDGHLRVDFSFQSAREQIPNSDEDFFPIAILGDFSGRTASEGSLSSPPPGPVRINCDNFDVVFKRFDVLLRLKPDEISHESISLSFGQLEDFHPDQLIRRIAPLSHLLDLRARLLDPIQAEAAVEEARKIARQNVLPTQITASSPAPTETTDDLLKRLLGKSETPGPKSMPAASTVEHLIKQIVTPSILPGSTVEQSDLARSLENELSLRLRAVLHDPDFQALEAAWRGIDFLVREISDQIGIYLVDISKADLAAQISIADLTKTAVFKQLEQIEPSVVLGIFAFEPGDHPLLQAVGSLMKTLGTSFVAAATSTMVGSRSFGSQPDPDDWAQVLQEFEALRRTPEASHLGLLAPRFILRQPYGPDSDPIEAFEFREVLASSEHESYLWGNSSFLCGYLLANAFAADGWDLDVGSGGQISGLPVHSLTREGAREAKPCAEAWLTERAANAILNQGIMPVKSIRGRDTVEIEALHSFALSSTPLVIRFR